MNRMSRGLIIGGVVASIAGLLWRRSSRRMVNRGTLNRFMYNTMDSMRRMNLLKYVNSSRLVKRLIR